MRHAAACLGLTLALLGPSPARAADDAEALAARAVQNRQFSMAHEFGASFGTVPTDPFDKGITVGGSYAWHFNPMWAWEVVNFNWVFHVDTGLKKELEANFAVNPSSIPVLDCLGDSGIIFKPFYGKVALLNRLVTHLESFSPPEWPWPSSRMPVRRPSTRTRIGSAASTLARACGCSSCNIFQCASMCATTASSRT